MNLSKSFQMRFLYVSYHDNKQEIPGSLNFKS